MSALNDLTDFLHDLPSPAKNRFFHNFPVNEYALAKDQAHEDALRMLLNRLTVGKGVLAGLDVGPAKGRDNDNAWQIELKPGVAVDAYGRMIVVADRIADADRVFLVWPDGVQQPDGYDKEPVWSLLWSLLVDSEGNPADPKGELAKNDVRKGCWDLLQGRAHDAPAILGRVAARLDTLGLAAVGPTDTVEVGWWAIEVAYKFTPTDPVRVGGCHCAEECAETTLREGFQVRFRRLQERPAGVTPHIPEDEPAPPDNPPTAADTVFPQEPMENRRHRGPAQYVRASGFPAQPAFAAPVTVSGTVEPGWVDVGLSVLTLKKDVGNWGLALTVEPYRRQIFSNDALSKLLFGLAERVDEASRVRRLVLADPAAGKREGDVEQPSGDGQRGDVLNELEKPLKVQVVDGLGRPVTGITNGGNDPASVKVRFKVLTPNGGKVDPADPGALTRTGEASVKWRLGRDPGVHLVEARLEYAGARAKPPFHPGDRVVFQATARPTAPTIGLMQFTDLFNDKCLQWGQNPKLTIGFSRLMNDDELNTPKPWIRVLRKVQRFVDCEGVETGPLQDVKLEKPKLAHIGGVDADRLTLVTYSIGDLVTGLCPQDRVRVLVLIHADVASDGTPYTGDKKNGQRLSALFRGSFLGQKLVEDTFKAAPFPVRPKPSEEVKPPITGDILWEWLTPREASLPSGDGFEGGWFHKAFELGVSRVC